MSVSGFVATDSGTGGRLGAAERPGDARDSRVSVVGGRGVGFSCRCRSDGEFLLFPDMVTEIAADPGCTATDSSVFFLSGPPGFVVKDSELELMDKHVGYGAEASANLTTFGG